jgi:hypothetical protein
VGGARGGDAVGFGWETVGKFQFEGFDDFARGPLSVLNIGAQRSGSGSQFHPCRCTDMDLA